MPRVRVIKVPVDSSSNTDHPSKPLDETARVTQRHGHDHQASEEKQIPASSIALSKRTIRNILITAGILILLAVAVLNREDTSKPESGKTGTVSNSDNEATALNSEVSAMVEVPSGQLPSVITVSDAAKSAATNPQLFRNAHNGDKVLLYTKESSQGKSVLYILYRPSSHKIVTAIEVNNNESTSPNQP